MPVICPACGGVVGRDCFNPDECMSITRAMANRYEHESSELHAACECISAFASGWDWEMLPNGERGWRWNGYLRDNDLRKLLEFASKNMQVEFPQSLT